MNFKLADVKPLAGFATGNVEPGEFAPFLARGMFTSEHQDFFLYMEQIAGLFLAPAGVRVDYVSHFLVVIHDGMTADLFVNDFPVEVEIKAKRGVKKGQGITHADMADIRSVKFPGVSLVPTDQVVYGFKVGWRFGLFFDFCSAPLTSVSGEPDSTPLNVDEMQVSIGELYRYLSFYGLYRVFESQTEVLEEMQNDGWFPFVETIPGEFESLVKAYKDKFHFEDHISDVVERFDRKRIRAIMRKWWKNGRFSDKRLLIEAGVKAYLQNTPTGFVNAIKTLLPEVEGLLRSIYRADGGNGKLTQKQFLANLASKAESKAGSEGSLLLPRPFVEYLTDQIFRNFDVEKGDVRLSRHSAAHGEAAVDSYSKARALQVILVLDQIYFFD